MNNISTNDKAKLERLFSTLERNFTYTRMQALYLERFPNIITPELVEDITSSSGIDKEYAIAALISEIFGLDTEKSSDDKRLFRDYILPSIRIMDAEKYRSDPYYRDVLIPSVKVGDWELSREAYEPYRAVIVDDMQIGEGLIEIAPLGFFTERFEFPAVLEGGNEWMTLTPVDLDTCRTAIDEAHGRVITFGLGLGYYAYTVALKDSVDSITVVEKSESVIELFNRYIRPHFKNPEKLRIINADAFEYAEKQMPTEEYDYAFVDTWRDASDGAPMYCRMKPLERLNPKTRFSYWIEGFIISRLRSLKYAKLKSAYDAGKLNMSYGEVLRALTDTAELIK